MAAQSNPIRNQATFTALDDSDVVPGNKTPRFVLWLFYLYIMSAPFFAFSLLNIGNRGILWVDWVTSAIFIAFSLLGVLSGRSLFPKSPMNLWIMLFAYSALFSIISLFSVNAGNNQFIDFATKGTQLVLALLFFYCVSSLALSEKDFKGIFRFWIIVATLVSIFAIYQVFAFSFNWPYASLSFNNPSVTNQGGEARFIQGFGQVSSVFREPSYLGAYLLAPIIIVGIFLLRGQGDQILFRSSTLNWSILAVLFAAFMLTSSQAAYLSLVVTVASMFTINKVGRWRVLRLIIYMLFLALIGGLVLSLFNIDFIGATIYRFNYLIINMMHPNTTLEVTSYRVRTECMNVAFQVWEKSPIIGVGLNNMSYYTTVCEFSLGWSQLLVDQGVIGVILMLMIFIMFIRELYWLSTDAKLSPFWSILCIAMIFVLVSDVVNGFFTYNWVDLQRWFNLALANLLIIHVRFRIEHISLLSLQNNRLSSQSLLTEKGLL